jgi:hypothetical protein
MSSCVVDSINAFFFEIETLLTLVETNLQHSRFRDFIDHFCNAEPYISDQVGPYLGHLELKY